MTLTRICLYLLQTIGLSRQVSTNRGWAKRDIVKAAELLVRCLENEGVEVIFGIPGEENVDILDVLLDSKIRFITTRHEQAAAFMADVYGRLTGRAGVCLATLGPGATNLVTGVADANMDRAPVVAISGQSSTTRMHKETHQHLDLVNLFRPISKYAVQVIEPETIPGGRAQGLQAGAEREAGGEFHRSAREHRPDGRGGQGALAGAAPAAADRPAGGHRSGRPKIISASQVSADHGGQRRDSRPGGRRSCSRCAERLNIPVANTFMAKGVVPFSHPLWLGAVGLQAHDYVVLRFRPRRRDCLRRLRHGGVPPQPLEPGRTKQIVHIDSAPAEVDEYYVPGVGVVGKHRRVVGGDRRAAPDRARIFPPSLWQAIMNELSAHADDASFPLKPQRIVWDLQRVLASRSIVVCDVGRTRSGWRGCISRSSPTRASSPTVSPRWGLGCPAPSPPSWPFRIARWPP